MSRSAPRCRTLGVGFSAFFPIGRQLAAALADVTDLGCPTQDGERIIVCGTVG